MTKFTDKESQLIEEANKYGINDNLELAYLLGQCAYESSNFTQLTESLNYSSEALLGMWPNKFSQVTANKYGRNSYHEANQKCIGNIVYGNRMGNLSSSNDGFNYRGRGYLQLTGRDNYQRFSGWLQKNSLGNELDIMGNPNIISSDDKIAALSAIWFWIANEIGQLARNNDIEAVTKTINGGLNGLQARKDLTDKYIQLFNL